MTFWGGSPPLGQQRHAVMLRADGNGQVGDADGAIQDWHGLQR